MTTPTTSTPAQAAAALALKKCGIGLTGGIGTGKSTVAKLLAAAGLLVTDADLHARQVVAKGSVGLAQIAATFGHAVLTPSQELDRKQLGAIIFAAPGKRHLLEQITHPLIRESLLAWIWEHDLVKRPRPFCYEAALIFEVNINTDFRAVWATWCPLAMQLERLMARDAVTMAKAQQIVAAQMDAKVKAERADLTICTDVAPEVLAQTVAGLVQRAASMV